MNKDQNHIDNLFDKARNQQPETSFEETSGQFLNDLEAGKTSNLTQGVAKSFNFKYLIMLSTISVIVISSIIYFNLDKPTEVVVNTVPIEKEIIESKVEAPLDLNKEIIIVETVTIKEEGVNIVTSTYNALVSDSVIVSMEVFAEKVDLVYLDDVKAVKKKNNDSVYHFPKLTQEQIAATNKQKKIMLRQLNKLDKKKYAYIPSGTFDANGKSVSVQAFYMQTTEVTNLEYRTFLFDLLIHSRKDEFLVAKPDQEKWLTVSGEKHGYSQPMVDMYFWHPAYYEYPVNNISREGAKLYCKWLTIEADKVRKKNKGTLNDVRLPATHEWEIAAIGNSEGGEFPWGGSSHRNKKGCYLANYRPLTDSMTVWSYDGKRYNAENKPVGVIEDDNSVKKDVYIMDNIGKDSAKVKYGEYAVAADGGFYTVKVNSYLPNGYGLYCMSGNVAEMVVDYENNNASITKGGGWYSVLDEIRIFGADNYKGLSEANANVGFRVVMSYLNK